MADKKIAVTLTGDASHLQRAFSTSTMAATNFGASVERSMERAKAANREFADSTKGVSSAVVCAD